MAELVGVEEPEAVGLGDGGERGVEALDALARRAAQEDGDGRREGDVGDVGDDERRGRRLVQAGDDLLEVARELRGRTMRVGR